LKATPQPAASSSRSTTAQAPSHACSRPQTMRRTGGACG
jgi:hypothetical protein